MKARTIDHVTHVRRCHVCGTVNELENMALNKCNCCGKHFAPFFYFNESDLLGLEIEKLNWSEWPHNGPEDGSSYRLIWGLSTYW